MQVIGMSFALAERFLFVLIARRLVNCKFE